jgi:chromosome segregation ATPase
MTPAEKTSARRVLYVENLNKFSAQLNESRAQLPAAEAAYRKEQDEYEALSDYVMASLRKVTGDTLKEMPSATHSWLTTEEKESLKMAKSALHGLRRTIESLEEQCSKWHGEIAFLDSVLAGDKLSSVQLPVPRPKPRIVEFDDIIMPAAVRK